MGVQVSGPGVYPTGQVSYLREAPGAKVSSHLLAAPTVMAHDYIAVGRVQFRKPVRYLSHGDVHGPLHMDLGVLPRFPHVQKHAGTAALFQEFAGGGGLELGDGSAGHGPGDLQNLKTRGVTAFVRTGRSVSNRLSRVQASSAVRVTSMASITGDLPTTTIRRPPTFKRCS